MAHRGHRWTRIFSGADKGTQNPRSSQKRVTSREIISVRSVKSVWDLKLRFAQVFEDECGLAGGEVRENG